ncbi:hypothetical protein RJ639_043051 [Escallonia herrerae]|uniref:RING-CH-type domain-containing protein n=1 Tax=Escallonia herrerae TaxID=1293975 RepID=A0AA88WGK4_9ASTE|nr:hypothetical protein RJ639_043051 [Escallonia herrerae]
MHGAESVGNGVANSDHCEHSCDLEKQSVDGRDQESWRESLNQTVLTMVVSTGDGVLSPQPVGDFPKTANAALTEVTNVISPKKAHLSRNTSFHEQCSRGAACHAGGIAGVCQEEKEETLINLGCHCRGGLAIAHRSCINTWFLTRGSNRCEICQQVTANVPPPDSQPSQPSYWVWRVGPAFRGSTVGQGRERGCFSPLWVAFAILIGGLLLDVLISITLGISALPVNIIIGVIIVLGLGTALRLALEFCHEWSIRRVMQRGEPDVNLGYHPAL